MQKAYLSKTIALTTLSIMLLLTMLPILLLLFMSIRDDLDIQIDFWAIPSYIKWENYTNALEAVGPNIATSVYICIVVVLGTTLIGSMTGYTFARHKFPAKSILYMLLLGVMMVPSVLTIVPLYGLVAKMGLIGSYWGLILVFISGCQLFVIVFSRTFIEGLPEELFEAARIDGGNEWYLYSRIAVPLVIPILVTCAIMNFLAVYNEYIWSLLVMGTDASTFAVAAVNLNSSGRPDMGLSFAAYVIGSIPMILVISFGMKYYVQGALGGAVKS